MKYSAVVVVAISTCVLFLSGCSINHAVKNDYPQYLKNNVGTTKLPTTSLEAQYEITPATASHKYEFRSVLTGYAHNWIVEFGQILDNTLQSTDVQNAFKKLDKHTDGDPAALLVFDLVNYRFSDFGAHVELKVTLQRKDANPVVKIYKADGRTQGGKMFWGGAFGMKNAIQQSTKTAIDQILIDLINDIEKNGS